eukprot:scaffold106115_cov66-Phaeocystis_antarctica.AAC.5
MRDGKDVHLGCFSTAEEAALAVARAVACTDSSPPLAAAKRATQPPKPPPAKQPRSSLASQQSNAAGKGGVGNGCLGGEAVEEAESLLAWIGLVVHKQFEGHGIFTGTVVEYYGSSGFRVEYSDGESEDVSHKTLVRRPRLSASIRLCVIACKFPRRVILLRVFTARIADACALPRAGEAAYVNAGRAHRAGALLQHGHEKAWRR